MSISVGLTPPLSTVRLPLVDLGARVMSLALREHTTDSMTTCPAANDT